MIVEDSTRFHTDILARLIQVSQDLLSPSQSQSLFQELGTRLGRHAWHEFTRTHILSGGSHIKDMVQCIASLEDLWGWPCTILQQREHSITVIVPTLPLKLPLSSMAVGLFTGMAEEAFGSAQVHLKPADGSAHLGTRIDICLQEGRAAMIPAQSDQGRRPVRDRKQPKNAVEAVEHLTLRERQVLQCIGEGFSNKQVAEYLTISVRTVEGHVSRICVKLDLRRRAELIRFALRHHLVPL